MPHNLPIYDTRNRPLRDLRVSVTDRCNFRCRYCMPREVFGHNAVFLPRAELLSFEEIARLVGVFAELGVRKVRLTGGEPLLRAELHKLVALISGIDGIEVALTTNGALLERHAERLVAAGLRRVTVSLDSLDPDVFHAMTDSDTPVAQVLAGIDAATRAGLAPVKVNAVVRRGINDHTVVDLARHFKGTGHVVRFIEYMDVGTSNGWRLSDVVSGREIIDRIDRVFPLEPVSATYRGEVARRYRYRDGSGEVGVITSVTQPFCGDCSRARLSSEGKLFTCLFAAHGTDLRAMLRGGASDSELSHAIERVWSARQDRYSEERAASAEPVERVEMHYIGG